MEKRLALAIVLIIGFMVFWSWLFPTSKVVPPPAPGQGAAAPESVPPGAPAPDSAESATPAATTPSPALAPAAAAKVPRAANLPASRAAAGGEEEVVIETPLAVVRLTNRGARVLSWRLKKYLDDAGQPLDLVSAAGREIGLLPLQFHLEDAEESRRLNEALYRVRREELTEGDTAITQVTMTYSDGAGLAASKVIRVPSDSYLYSLEVAAQSAGRPVTPAVVWGAGFGSHNGLEAGQFDTGAGAVVNVSGRSKLELRSSASLKPETPWVDGGVVGWAGLEDKYFAAILIPEAPSEGKTRVESIRLAQEGREHFFLALSLHLPGVERYHIFVGPKDLEILKRQDRGLDRLLDFGFFSIVALPLFSALKFVEGYAGNFGWAIIILTIVIRLLFFPFMHSSQVKMRRMQDKMKRVQPKIKSMRERYRKLEKKEAEKGVAGGRQRVREKMNAEMMAIYKEEGINPLGSMSGCLPLLAQMPILYGFYTILTIAIELRKAPFLLWIRDLSLKDPYFVTPIVMGATMLIQQVMTSSSIADPGQRRMMYIMPVMFTYFFINLPSGLVLYWLVNNILGIAQQYFVNRQAAAEQVVT